MYLSSPFLVEISESGRAICNGNDDRRIPLLREIFEAFGDVPINIDIKTNNDKLIEKVGS